MNIRVDGALMVERPHPEDFCRHPSFKRTTAGGVLILDYACGAVPVVSIAGHAYCAEHGEKRLSHSLFEALEQALAERVQEAV